MEFRNLVSSIIFLGNSKLSGLATPYYPDHPAFVLDGRELSVYKVLSQNKVGGNLIAFVGTPKAVKLVLKRRKKSEKIRQAADEREVGPWYATKGSYQSSKNNAGRMVTGVPWLSFDGYSSTLVEFDRIF